MTKVDSKTFWTEAFDADEAEGLTVRVGPFRTAPMNEKWAIMRDGAEYPPGKVFDTRQEAIDFMVEDFFAGGALSIPDDQERDREEFHGPSIKSQLEPHSCKVCMTLFTAITRISDLHHLQNVVATAQGHINRHHS